MIVWLGQFVCEPNPLLQNDAPPSSLQLLSDKGAQPGYVTATELQRTHHQKDFFSVPSSKNTLPGAQPLKCFSSSSVDTLGILMVGEKQLMLTVDR